MPIFKCKLRSIGKTEALANINMLLKTESSSNQFIWSKNLDTGRNNVLQAIEKHGNRENKKM